MIRSSVTESRGRTSRISRSVRVSDASSDAELRVGPAGKGPIVREVQGRGSFQIRKVTKADAKDATKEPKKEAKK